MESHVPDFFISVQIVGYHIRDRTPPPEVRRIPTVTTSHHRISESFSGIPIISIDSKFDLVIKCSYIDRFLSSNTPNMEYIVSKDI